MKPSGKPLFDKAWRARSEVVPCRVADTMPFLLRHYLHKRPAVVVASFLLQVDGVPMGTCVYALPPKQTVVRYKGETWELARLFVDDVVPTNAETFLIGATVRAIRREHPSVTMLVSYADPSRGHSGTIYRAANWVYDGMTDSDRKSPRFDYSYDGVRYSRRGHVPVGCVPTRIPRVSKHRYIFRLRGVPS